LEASGEFSVQARREREKIEAEALVQRFEEEKENEKRLKEEAQREAKEERQRERKKAKEMAEKRLNDALAVMGDFSWRTAVMYLRALHPQGGNASGVGAPLDPEAKPGIYTRILDMRDSLVGVMRRKKARADRRQLLIRALQEMEETDEKSVASDPVKVAKLRAIQRQLQSKSFRGIGDTSNDGDDSQSLYENDHNGEDDDEDDESYDEDGYQGGGQGDYGDLNIYAENLSLRLNIEDHHMSAALGRGSGGGGNYKAEIARHSEDDDDEDGSEEGGG
jgi:hypothetical protein